MEVLLKVGNDAQRLCSADVLNSFFETVACRLEPDGRATRFPLVSGDLKFGRLTRSHASAALHELDVIELELRNVPASRILWEGPPPTPDPAVFALVVGQLREALKRCQSTGGTLTITSPAEVRRQCWIWICLLLGGAAWTLFGYALFPGWLISPIIGNEAHPSGLPIWTFGITMSVFAILGLLGLALPGTRIWIMRRKWAINVLSFAVIASWMALSYIP